MEAPFVWHVEVVVLMEIQPGLTASGFQHARDTLDNLPQNPPTSTSPTRQSAAAAWISPSWSSCCLFFCCVSGELHWKKLISAKKKKFENFDAHRRLLLLM